MTTQFPDSLIPSHEAVRLRTLHQFQIVNTTPEQIFDDYVACAAQLFSVPIALISLVDADYVWFKAIAGATVSGLERQASMCSAAILSSDTVVISDYSPESCNLIRPDVAQANGLKFYAGAALLAPNDSHLGMLAVIAREPRDFSAIEVQVLTRLAGLVSQTIELRYRYLRDDQLAEWEDAQRELSQTLDDNAALVRYLATRGQGIDLADPDIARPVGQRLTNVANILRRRLGHSGPVGGQ